MSNEYYMLTTKDNPWNPFTNYDEWNAWDEAHGYYTSAYLARITNDSPELSEAQLLYSVNTAIDEILYFNLTGNYIKVTPKDYENWVPVENSDS